MADALSLWCEKAKRNPDNVFVWLCALCHNQYGSYSSNSESNRDGFLHEAVLHEISGLQTQLHSIGTLLVLMSPIESPLYLQRAWCLFEFYSACSAPKCDIRILLSRGDEERLQATMLQYDGFSRLFDCISIASIQNAKTSEPHDRDGILRFLFANDDAELMPIQQNVHDVLPQDGYLSSQCKSAAAVEIVNGKISEALMHWFFDKAQALLQRLIGGQAWVPPEAFANVGSLLCRDAQFAPLGYLVLQQGLQYSRVSGTTTTAGYAFLLKNMGKCLESQGRHQEARLYFADAEAAHPNSNTPQDAMSAKQGASRLLLQTPRQIDSIAEPKSPIQEVRDGRTVIAKRSSPETPPADSVPEERCRIDVPMPLEKYASVNLRIEPHDQELSFRQTWGPDLDLQMNSGPDLDLHPPKPSSFTQVGKCPPTVVDVDSIVPLDSEHHELPNVLTAPSLERMVDGIGMMPVAKDEGIFFERANLHRIVQPVPQFKSEALPSKEREQPSLLQRFYDWSVDAVLGNGDAYLYSLPASRPLACSAQCGDGDNEVLYAFDPGDTDEAGSEELEQLTVTYSTV